MKTEPIGSLVAELAESGIVLIPNGEKLKIQSAEEVADSVMDTIKEKKVEILDYLSHEKKFLDPFDSEAMKTSRTDLLTEVELEAFNGWYASCRKPKFGMNHEEATLKSWKLLIESMQILYKERGDRYKP
jgi:hypothetical protein|tara:strand:+ start:2700 stop:3089 length:390 start_codon:yes stop_codon:yes gene_type:complete